MPPTQKAYKSWPPSTPEAENETNDILMTPNAWTYVQRLLKYLSSKITGVFKSSINQINFIGIKSSHRTVTSHMYTVTQEQSQT